MSAKRYVASSDRNLNPEILDRVLELTGGEDPVRYITMSEPDTALGLIRGIKSMERLAGWRLANQSFFDPPRSRITRALNTRERELTGANDPEPEPEPQIDEPESKPEPKPEQEPEPEPRETHADSRLDAGKTLVVDWETRTEYVFPARPSADDPYVACVLDDGADDPRHSMTLSNNELVRRLDREPETVDVTDVPVDVSAFDNTVGGAGR